MHLRHVAAQRFLRHDAHQVKQHYTHLFIWFPIRSLSNHTFLFIIWGKTEIRTWSASLPHRLHHLHASAFWIPPAAMSRLFVSEIDSFSALKFPATVWRRIIIWIVHHRNNWIVIIIFFKFSSVRHFRSQLPCHGQRLQKYLPDHRRRRVRIILTIKCFNNEI